MTVSTADVAFRFEDLSSLSDVDATLTYETDDTLELSQQEEEAGKEEDEGPVGKKRKLAAEVCRNY